MIQQPVFVCPHCGYCPHCGRSNAPSITWQQPSYQPTKIWSGGMGGTATPAYRNVS